ncbi:hypothetical protein F5X99DRAFT_245144 [Biscogniauxia marginata]|nr:hypothetical protein F5X99DRAFT_245144 [Biscogniauxia marginata]
MRSDTDKIVRQCFQIQVVSHSVSRFGFRDALLGALQLATMDRRRLGMEFSGRHLQSFLRLALAHCAKEITAPFPLYQAGRIDRPIPPDLHTYLASFLQSVAVAGICPTLAAAPVVASALLVDAYPPQSHGRALKAPMLCSLVEENFVRIASRSPSRLGRCDEEHCVCLQTASLGAMKCSNACVFCLIRFPEHTLPC